MLTMTNAAFILWTVYSWLTLNTEDDCIGVLHVGLADAENGFLSIWCHPSCHRLRETHAFKKKNSKDCICGDKIGLLTDFTSQNI